ncbi:hypothetical protein [Thermus brockianus]
MWEAVVLREGRMVGYGQGVSRVDAVERAIRDALRRGYSVPLAQAYLAWWEGVVLDVRDVLLRVIKELAR